MEPYPERTNARVSPETDRGGGGGGAHGARAAAHAGARVLMMSALGGASLVRRASDAHGAAVGGGPDSQGGVLDGVRLTHSHNTLSDLRSTEIDLTLSLHSTDNDPPKSPCRALIVLRRDELCVCVCTLAYVPSG